MKSKALKILLMVTILFGIIACASTVRAEQDIKEVLNVNTSNSTNYNANTITKSNNTTNNANSNANVSTNNTNNTNNTNKTNNTNSNVVNTINNNVNTNLPSTGSATTNIAIVLIVALALIGIISFARAKYYRNI